MGRIIILLFSLLSKNFAAGHCAVTIDPAPSTERLKTIGLMRLKIETSSGKKTQDFYVTPYKGKFKFYIKAAGKAIAFVVLGAIGHFLYTLI